MVNVVSLRAQADDAVIRAEVAATGLRTADDRLAACAARLDRARAERDDRRLSARNGQRVSDVRGDPAASLRRRDVGIEGDDDAPGRR
jgi:hypothetical protein